MKSRLWFRLTTFAAGMALVLLWPTDRSLLWWGILALTCANIFVRWTMDTALKIEAKAFVVRFWGRLHTIFTAIVLGLSLMGILSVLR